MKEKIQFLPTIISRQTVWASNKLMFSPFTYKKTAWSKTRTIYETRSTTLWSQTNLVTTRTTWWMIILRLLPMLGYHPVQTTTQSWAPRTKRCTLASTTKTSFRCSRKAIITISYQAWTRMPSRTMASSYLNHSPRPISKCTPKRQEALAGTTRPFFHRSIKCLPGTSSKPTQGQGRTLVCLRMQMDKCWLYCARITIPYRTESNRTNSTTTKRIIRETLLSALKDQEAKETVTLWTWEGYSLRTTMSKEKELKKSTSTSPSTPTRQSMWAKIDRAIRSRLPIITKTKTTTPQPSIRSGTIKFTILRVADLGHRPRERREHTLQFNMMEIMGSTRQETTSFRCRPSKTMALRNKKGASSTKPQPMDLELTGVKLQLPRSYSSFKTHT